MNNFGLVILPIHSFSIIDCTHLKVYCELVSLVVYICRVDTQGDGEGDSFLYLGHMLVKLTRDPWRVHPWLKPCGNVHQGIIPLSISPT
jgi:hypothetical protein